jgi:hypothetical protein
MKRYKLSFLLSGLLLAGAFVAMYLEKTSRNKFTNGASYILLIGGVILAIVGQREYNEQNKSENKNKVNHK